MNFLQKFMQGRYGTDQFSLFLLVGSLVLSIVFRIFSLSYPYIINLLILLFVFYRTFSKNINVRYKENQKFLEIIKPIRLFLKKIQRRFNNRKKYRYFTCKNCKQEMRVPKGKGKIEITCPKCKTKAIKRT